MGELVEAVGGDDVGFGGKGNRVLKSTRKTLQGERVCMTRVLRSGCERGRCPQPGASHGRVEEFKS